MKILGGKMKSLTKILPIGVALAIGLTACGGAGQSAPEPNVSAPVTPGPTESAPVSEASVSPTPSETAEPTPSATEASGPIEPGSLMEMAKYEQLMEMDQTEFDALPQPQRLQVVDAQEEYYYPGNEDDGYVFGVDYPTDNSDLYEYNPREHSQPDAEAMDVAQGLLHDQQLIVAQFFENPDDMELATQYAEKILSGLVVDPTDKGANAYGLMKTLFIDSLAEQQGVVGVAEGLATAPKLTSLNIHETITMETGADGKEVPTMNVSFTAERGVNNGKYLPAGEDNRQVFTYTTANVTYTGLDGKKRNHWVVVDFMQSPATK